ncbi:hypothetical protein JCM24511_01009 [Saitozyma sp. JCM 24511]|nr:hypothetical protein JCM24511_01009 [Saitozyma sp. JCM 24511]
MAPLLRSCSGLVIRCFKHVEAFADWITGAAGPVFVFLCWSLIGLGGFVFFDVVVRDFSFLTFLLLSPILLLVPLNLYLQYYLVTSIPSGFPAPRPSGPTKAESRWLVPNPKSLWAPERWGFYRSNAGGRPLTGHNGGVASEPRRRVRRCRKCDGPKPERTHHCSVCKRCVLLMDHHCPWINGCVGLHNQRHFILFMAWLSISCWVVCALGYGKFWESFAYLATWPAWTPKIGFTLLYVLSMAIGIAVPVLMAWHLHMVSHGETSIESHDNAYLEGKARAEGLIYLNPYDLGRRRNLELFFNIGPTGYRWTTLLLPLVVQPYTNGWSFPRRSLPTPTPSSPSDLHLHAPELAAGLSSGQGPAENGMAVAEGKYVMGDGNGDLTDDEEGGGGWMDEPEPGSHQ